VTTTFRVSFTRDLKKIKERAVLAGVRRAVEGVEAAPDTTVVVGLKKLSGTSNSYRIRVGEYRIGVVIEGDTVEFVRRLNRKDPYRFFP